jgi:hypothetical protein
MLHPSHRVVCQRKTVAIRFFLKFRKNRVRFRHESVHRDVEAIEDAPPHRKRPADGDGLPPAWQGSRVFPSPSLRHDVRTVHTKANDALAEMLRTGGRIHSLPRTPTFDERAM